MTLPPRVRFAPSPTGFLHVGGARTAIFNWLFARRHGGTFILRIEDTDLERSSDEVVRAILDGLAWLGMPADEGPFFQSQRRDTHVQDARRALDGGHAYRCFCLPDEAARARAEAESLGRVYLCPRGCRDQSPEESRQRSAAEPFAVRFKVPSGTTAWTDLVHAAMSFANGTIEDFVLLRSDGTPTYMLSVVSDDIAMKISHVVRGDDHISNTPKQLLLYAALGVAPPTFAHLPLILGDDKKRLSKRHGATSVLEYRAAGYLPEAIFNFLTLLGWSPGDERQKMTRQELTDSFDFPGVGISPAVFDLKKLDWLNGQYLAELPPDEMRAEVKPRLIAAGLWDPAYDSTRKAWLMETIKLFQPRCRTLAEFAQSARPVLDPSDDFPYEDDAVKKHLKGDGQAATLQALRERLAGLHIWNRATLEDTFRAQAAEQGISAGKLIHPARLAATGRGASPGLFEVLELLGPERTLARIDRLIAILPTLTARES